MAPLQINQTVTPVSAPTLSSDEIRTIVAIIVSVNGLDDFGEKLNTHCREQLDLFALHNKQKGIKFHNTEELVLALLLWVSEEAGLRPQDVLDFSKEAGLTEVANYCQSLLDTSSSSSSSSSSTSTAASTTVSAPKGDVKTFLAINTLGPAALGALARVSTIKSLEAMGEVYSVSYEVWLSLEGLCDSSTSRAKFLKYIQTQEKSTGRKLDLCQVHDTLQGQQYFTLASELMVHIESFREGAHYTNTMDFGSGRSAPHVPLPPIPVSLPPIPVSFPSAPISTPVSFPSATTSRRFYPDAPAGSLTKTLNDLRRTGGIKAANALAQFLARLKTDPERVHLWDSFLSVQHQSYNAYLAFHDGPSSDSVIDYVRGYINSMMGNSPPYSKVRESMITAGISLKDLQTLDSIYQ